MENKQFWDAMRIPPETALRKIEGGRLKGKTDINPEWRFQIMTEVFGPVGFGWYYEIVRVWNEEAKGTQTVFAFAEIKVYIKIGNEWSKPIPGIGGSTLVEKEKDYLYPDDEGYKMAITDAISVALKALGVAAEVYLGNFDGTKYQGHGEDSGQPAAKSAPSSQRTPPLSQGDSNAALRVMVIDALNKAVSLNDKTDAQAKQMLANFDNKSGDAQAAYGKWILDHGVKSA